MTTTTAPQQTIASIAQDAGFHIIAQVERPGHAPTRAQLPTNLHPALLALLTQRHPDGLWSHQRFALDAALAGRDVCLATSTASGKSLVFQTACLQRALEVPGSRALALYPMKALAEDQLVSWRALAEPLGLIVERIDGDIAIDRRADLIERAHILVMTPDVVHAWWMANLADERLARLLASVRSIVLDEAHVYDGVFGSNMAYLLRRIEAQLPHPALILSATATVHEPGALLEALTGRAPVVLGPQQDGAPRHAQHVLALQASERAAETAALALLQALATRPTGRFLLFADSRKSVEHLMSKLRRLARRDEEALGADLPEEAPEDAPGPALRAPGLLDDALGVMPYRAGYEDADRRAIQTALARGALRGVLATSAMELGIDIGDVDVVVCLGLPHTARSLMQRLGRAGRRGHSTALILDTERVLTDDAALAALLARQPEPCRLYLHNRYLQFSQAMCAAHELAARCPDAPADHPGRATFASLGAGFMELLDAELVGGGFLDGDLEELRRAGMSGPHRAAQLRAAMEPTFRIERGVGRNMHPMGDIQLGQLMREAYPGGTYYHMGHSYEVCFVDRKRGVVALKWGKPRLTEPDIQTRVFPALDRGVLGGRVTERALALEVELQANERVVGFHVITGEGRTTHTYGPSSPYARQPITRYIRTTGVVLWLPGLDLSQSFGAALADAACRQLGIHPQDLGVGSFHYQGAPPWGGQEPCKLSGVCIFDSTHGSLRLSGLVLTHMDALLAALEQHEDETTRRTASALRVWWSEARAWRGAPPLSTPAASKAAELIMPGSTALLLDGADMREVVVRRVRFHPSAGLVYELAPEPGQTGRHEVPLHRLEPIPGVSMLDRYDADEDVWAGQPRAA